MFNIKKIIFLIIFSFLIFSICFVIFEIYIAQVSKDVEKITFEVKNGESVNNLANRLEKEKVIRNAWFFKKYLVLIDKDKQIRVGEYYLTAPITLARVVEVLSELGLSEQTITIIPGWNIRDVSKYLVSLEKFQVQEITNLLGLPAVKNNVPKLDLDFKILQDKPDNISYEGYLAPDTYQIYKNASLENIINKLVQQRDKQITDQMWQDIEKSGKSFHEILVMASILEREVKTFSDKKKVADIFWRRLKMNWALQADSTVHYLVGKSGNVFTTAEDRSVDSLWNTYKYPGLPPSPICNPSLESIQAALYPEKNNNWYFLTDKNGKVHYARTLEEHNINKKYL